jgi:hypothetical protein
MKLVEPLDVCFCHFPFSMLNSFGLLLASLVLSGWWLMYVWWVMMADHQSKKKNQQVINMEETHCAMCIPAERDCGLLGLGYG